MAGVRLYPVVVCDDDGYEKPNTPLHWAVTNEEGESLPGTCSTLLASGAYFIPADSEIKRGRVWCKVCGRKP